MVFESTHCLPIPIASVRVFGPGNDLDGNTCVPRTFECVGFGEVESSSGVARERDTRTDVETTAATSASVASRSITAVVMYLFVLLQALMKLEEEALLALYSQQQ